MASAVQQAKNYAARAKQQTVYNKHSQQNGCLKTMHQQHEM
jgi:hypothetical protein